MAVEGDGTIVRSVTTEPRTPVAQDPQARLNATRWSRGDFVREYANRTLRPAEVVVLARHHDGLSGRLLELGCGAGRLTGYLAELAASVEAIDVSPRMVDHVRRTYPSVDSRVGDLRDLSGLGDDSYDAVVAPFSVLDVLDDPERRRVLDEVHRILVPGGTFVLSSHNRAFARRLRKPSWVLARTPGGVAVKLLRFPRRQRNHRRLVPLERSEPGYAVINDDAHDFQLLHYYIGRDAQAQQLSEHGFALVECLDLEGHRVGAGETGEDSVELHYVARAT
jgi:SAM-dependent methyltransferase